MRKEESGQISVALEGPIVASEPYLLDMTLVLLPSGTMLIPRSR